MFSLVHDFCSAKIGAENRAISPSGFPAPALVRIIRAILLSLLVVAWPGGLQPARSMAVGPLFVAINAGPCVYDNLTAAVMAAQPGDTLVLAAGAWPGSVMIDKDLTLRGGYDATCNGPGVGVTTLRGEGSQIINVIAGRVALHDLVLTDGEATFGAALRAINGSQVTLDHTQVIDNKAFDRGGGVFVDDNAVVTLTHDSNIIGNQAQTRGGGLFVSPGGTAVLAAGSDLARNTAGGIEGGGAAWVGGTLILEGPNTSIAHNLAPNGGGLAVVGQANMPARLTIREALIVGNVTTAGVSRGGGVLISRATLVLEHSQVLSNTAALGGGIAVEGSSVVTLTNNLLASNEAAAPSAGAALNLSGKSTAVVQQNTFSHNDENAIVVEQVAGGLVLTNNVIWNHTQGSVITAGGPVQAICNDTEFGPLPGLGNIAADPVFVAPNAGNFRLRVGSPALDQCAQVPTPHDLDQRPRPQAFAADMGAYEGVGCPADVNQDGALDLRDVQLVAGHFTMLPTYDGTWDYDVVQNGVVDVQDIVGVATLWHRYCW